MKWFQAPKGPKWLQARAVFLFFWRVHEGSATGSGATLTQLPRVMAWIKRWRERVSEADDATRKDDRNMRQKTVCANAEPPASPACGPLLLKVTMELFAS